MFPPAKRGYNTLLREPTIDDRRELFHKLKNYGKFTGLYWLRSPEPQMQPNPLPIVTINIYLYVFLLSLHV